MRERQQDGQVLVCFQPILSRASIWLFYEWISLKGPFGKCASRFTSTVFRIKFCLNAFPPLVCIGLGKKKNLTACCAPL